MHAFRLKFGIGTKTLIALSLVFWLPVSALALLLTHFFGAVLEDEVASRANVHFKGAVTIFEKRTEMLEKMLSQYAHRPEVKTAMAGVNSGELQNLLLEFGKRNPHVALLAAVDSNQKVLGRRNGQSGDTMTLGNVLSNALMSGEPHSANELVSVDLLVREDAELTNAIKEPAIVRYAIAPVHNGEEVIGALVAGILLSGDSWLGNTIYSRFGVEFALFAGNPREAFQLHATTSMPRNIWAWGQVMPTELKEKIELGKPFRSELNIAGIRITAAFEPISDSHNRIIGAIGIGTPLMDAGSAVTNLIAKAIGITSVIGLVVALVSVFFVRHDITYPLGVLNKAMHRFGGGELDTRVNLETGDQLEDLGEMFNKMADGICRRERRFKKHNEVSKLFMSTMDMDHLLDQTLRIVVAVTDSQLGVLYLWNKENRVFEPRAQYGTTTDLETFKEGEGYVGRAAKDAATLVLKFTEDTEILGVNVGFLTAVPEEVAHIPLIYQDQVLGVLVLGSLRAFSQDEWQLFDYLADQISLALDNALMHQKIHELSIKDSLTGLHNRRSLNSRLEQEWARSVRHNTPISILLADIDDFKSINDNYGHEFGDEVLCRVAEIFSENARKEDVVARYGGEEIVVLLAETNGQEARRTADRICGQAREIRYPGMDRQATLSIGVASFPECLFDDFEELILAADQAMYQAKTSGKNRVEVFAVSSNTPGKDSDQFG
ncbi:diguanylate cyclase [Thiohalomonas denitrificans]|uniref:diguanylate cyclase n=1 Tax=Thiohalomonas denitrificans TaxID=415747 RepID=UPI0026EFE41B|nr:diguanylate cyclase [Thiohalomonas denitrificans]